MIYFLNVAVAIHHQTIAAKMVLHIKMHDYSIVVIHTCVATIEKDGGNVVIRNYSPPHPYIFSLSIFT